MSGDPERDKSNPRPTAPAGVLSGPGKRPESAPVDPKARVPKSVFAHTIAMPGAAPVPPPSEAEKLTVPHSTSDAAEPLREPSERPAPTPYKRANAWGGTMLMPDVGKPPGSRSEERMIAAKPGMRVESAAVEVHAAAKVGTPRGALGEPTVRMATAAESAPSPTPPSNRPSGLPAAPPPSGAPPGLSAKSPAAKSPIPPAPVPSTKPEAAKRDDHSVPRLSLGVENVPSGAPALKPELSQASQPIQLSLNASDHVETSLRPEAAVPTRSMLPWIVLGVLLIGGAAAYALTRSDDEPAVAPERVEAVPAEPAQAKTPTNDVPQAAAPTEPGAPAAPVKPSAPAQAPEAAPPASKPVVEAKAQDAKPAIKRKARRTTKPAAQASGPVLKVSPQGEGDLEEALRAAERMAEPEEELEPPEPPAAEPPSPDGE